MCCCIFNITWFLFYFRPLHSSAGNTLAWPRTIRCFLPRCYAPFVCWFSPQCPFCSCVPRTGFHPTSFVFSPFFSQIFFRCRGLLCLSLFVVLFFKIHLFLACSFIFHNRFDCLFLIFAFPFRQYIIFSLKNTHDQTQEPPIPRDVCEHEASYTMGK